MIKYLATLLIFILLSVSHVFSLENSGSTEINSTPKENENKVEINDKGEADSNNGESLDSDSEIHYTGLDQNEEDAIFLNRDRNISKYSPNEDDGLFDVLSKAYIRNLERVFIRRKR